MINASEDVNGANEPDPSRVRRLADDMLELIKTNYVKGPESPDRVLEALEALAMDVAVVTAAADDADLARRFFVLALSDAILAIRPDPPATLQ